ncbi:MAG: hypothetical protein HZC40_23395 [Chloroflexi bacterium]|nr:hypothetical protein [Chloroflexota bacterium]
MISLGPANLMILGFILLVIGFILPFVMVLRIVEPTIALNFIAYISSVMGLAIGLLGIASHVQSRK